MPARDTDDPFKDEIPGKGTLGQPQPMTQSGPRKAPAKIDWKAAARLWAEGAKPAAIAAQLGIEEERIWRHLKRSARFRFYLSREIERRRLQAQVEFLASGQAAVLERSRDAERLDGEDWRWLAERSIAADAATVPPPPGSTATIPTATGPTATGPAITVLGIGCSPLVNALAETGGLPPTRAQRQRMAARGDRDAERAEIAVRTAEFEARLKALRAKRQAEAAEARAKAEAEAKERAKIDAAARAWLAEQAGAWRASAGAAQAQTSEAQTSEARLSPAQASPAQAQSPSTESSGPPRSGTVAGGPQRSGMDSSGHQRSETGSSGPQRSDMGSSGYARAIPAAWTPPVQRPGEPPPSRASLYRSIVDLPGPDHAIEEAGGPS